MICNGYCAIRETIKKNRCMDRKYWEKIAPDYDAEIFDVLANDKKHYIISAIQEFAGPGKSIIDIGCAVGKWIPVLAPRYRRVYAIDISSKNLSIAKRRFSDLDNVVFERVDMMSSKAAISRCDVALCINAILTPSLQGRSIFFKNLAAAVKKGGHIILVVPSLESTLMAAIIAHRWKVDGIGKSKIKMKEASLKWEHIVQGNIYIDGVPTKHYLQDEIRLILAQEGLEAIKFQKIEYSWHTEFLRPPVWLKSPYPWDWMCVAKKKAR
jgi:2-polyprenyl-3-methyl-5-hydroxy-6-metoxy-1,4-benzoquinol methylase